MFERTGAAEATASHGPAVPGDGAAAPAGGRGARLRSRFGAALVAAVAVLAAGCGGGDDAPMTGPGALAGDPAAGAPTDAPGWVADVYPQPSAQTTGELAVTLDFTTLRAGRSVRLVVDGVDVTSQAIVGGAPETTTSVDQVPEPVAVGPGQLRYDPQELRSPLVELVPGEHVARAELVERLEFGEPARVVDSYEWEFSVL